MPRRIDPFLPGQYYHIYNRGNNCQAIFFERENYLIHANPVKDGLVASPEEWEYSNYLEWMGLRNGTLVNRQFEENFGAPEEYKQLVTNYIRTRRLPDDFRKYIQECE